MNVNAFQITLMRRQGMSNKDISEKTGLTEEEVVRLLRDYQRHVQSANSASAYGMKEKKERRV